MRLGILGSAAIAILSGLCLSLAPSANAAGPARLQIADDASSDSGDAATEPMDAPADDQTAPSGGGGDVTAHCEVTDCVFCDNVLLTIEGGPEGVHFTSNGESSYVTIYSTNGGVTGDYTMTCSWQYEDQPHQCTASVAVSGTNRNVFMQASSTNCEYTSVSEF